jgi:hypothetical protein
VSDVTDRPQAQSDDPAGDTPSGTGPLPWREIVQFALLGVLGLLVLVLVDVSRYGGSNPVSLIQPGTLGPSTGLIAEDFPDIEQPEASGLDGQQYYAIAAHPTDLDAAAEHLDWPRYRWQRPLLPWTAALVSGGSSGLPLVWALFAVGTAAAFGGALASGALSTMWRGPAWVAAVFPLLPGAYWSLRVTVSDAMALALALGAVALAARSRHLPAIALGVLAVLAKEPAILILAGWALHRRTRRDAMVAIVPAGAVVAWMAVLATSLPPDPDRAQDIAAPFVGLVQAFTDVWSQGNELVGMACTLGGLALGIAALVVRRLRHPLGWAIAIQLAFVLVMGVNPTSVNFGATRMAMPVMMLSIIALATPYAPDPDPDPTLAS